MEPTGGERHGRSPKGERAGASESIEPAVEATLRLSTSRRIAERPRRESNPHLRFRKPPFYPLNYGDKSIADFRLRNADWLMPIRLPICGSRDLETQLADYQLGRNCLGHLRKKVAC